MNAKTTLVLIALIGVGLVALPQTMALFAGQHTFVNIDATGNQIECLKCHGDIQAEMTTALGTNPMTGTVAPHANFTCEYCHRVEAGAASGDNAYGQLTYSNGNSSIVLLVTLQDMEALNVPTSITVNGTKSATTISTKAMIGTSKVSECYKKSTTNTACTEDNATELFAPEPSGMKEIPTYNTATHIPKDTNTATKNSGLDLTKINITIAPGTDSKGRATATLTYNLDGAGSRAVNPGSSYHAASLVSCMECHGGSEPMSHNVRMGNGEVNNGSAVCSNCHYGRMAGDLANESGTAGTGMFTLQAGGFGFNVTESDTGATEAHKAFQTQADGLSRQKVINGQNVNNGACVACHTHVAVDIQYTRPSTYQFTAVTDTNGDTVVDSFVAAIPNVITYSDAR